MSESRGKAKQAGSRTASPRGAPVLSTRGTSDQTVKLKLQSQEPSKRSEIKASDETGEVRYMCRGNRDKECGREIRDENCICCDVCEKWYHMNCQLKSVEEFEAIRRFKLFWVCTFCQDMLPTLIEQSKWKEEVSDALGGFKNVLRDQAGAVAGVASSNKDLCKIQEKANQDFKKQLEEHAGLIQACHVACTEQSKLISEVVQRIEAKVTVQENIAAEVRASEQEKSRSYADAVKSLGAQIEELSSMRGKGISGSDTASGVAVTKVVGNFFDKEKRRNNIVVHNLPESSVQDPKERSQKDAETFKSLVQEEFKLRISVVKVFRAGKIQPEKPRPLIVTLDDEGVKWDILRLAPQLRGHSMFGNVFLSPDRTPEERERDRNLRVEARRLREEGKTVRIHKGRVVVLDAAPTASAREREGAVRQSV